jgi:cytochrome c oxidase cbb3-type subunit 4
MDLGMILSLWTVLVMVIFVFIVIWAWSSRRKKAFDEAARIPLEDDEVSSPNLVKGKR